MKKFAALGIVAVSIVALTAQMPKPKGTAGRAGSDEAALIEIENSWNEAAMKKDVATLDKYYADDVTDVGPDGTMTTKAEDLDAIKTGVFAVESATAEDLKPRIYGNTAVVTGTGTMKGTYKGEDISGRYRFTDTFVKKNGQWQCVATQATKIVEKQ